MSATTPIKIFSRLKSPNGLFVCSFLLLFAGAGVNHLFRLKGVLHLETGKEKNLTVTNLQSSNPVQKDDDLGFILTLDSLKIQPHTPRYEIVLWKKDTTAVSPHSPGKPLTNNLVDRFSLEPMKIRKIERTDFRFRLKEFYPNFEFAYQYPEDRDTIEPRAPGITLELKTIEGNPIVTLRTDQVNKHTLGDIVRLGASLVFYWDISPDSINAMALDKENTENKIVFSGVNNKVFFILNGRIDEQPLKEKVFYKMPGTDSTGFTIIHCFPDISFLKAVPSSRGTELLTPVAHIEIWRPGESSIDAFVYPETRTRKGGEFEIPGSDYKLGLKTDQENETKFCDCSISFLEKGSEVTEKLTFNLGKSKRYQGYRFSPVECKEGVPGKITMEIVRNPGRTFIFLGFLMGAFAVLISIFRVRSVIS